MRNFIAFPCLSVLFFRLALATILRRNHMCLIFSTISLLPTCWNLWILRRRMAGFAGEREWRRCSQRSRLISPFHPIAFWGCHECATFFPAFEWCGANITITTHYPRSHKTKEIAATKWLLCGADPFPSPIWVPLKRYLFIFIAISSTAHCGASVEIFSSNWWETASTWNFLSRTEASELSLLFLRFTRCLLITANFYLVGINWFRNFQTIYRRNIRLFST